MYCCVLTDDNVSFRLPSSYVTMEEHLSACEHHLQLKTSEVDKLTQEAKSWKEKVR